jgi:hypothetical protein
VTIYRFRSTPSYAAGDTMPKVDARAGVIRGVSLAEGVEALGHGMDLDATSLQQVCDQVNAAGNQGLKSRLGHPGACEDATGKMLGRVKDARVEGNKAVADLYLSQASRSMPGKGDVFTWALKRAQEDPASFGMSIAFSGMPAWKLSDGTEVPAFDKDGERIKRPELAVGPRPRARIGKLSAADVVEDPAANRDGLFAQAFSGTTSAVADEAFATIDAYLAEHGIAADRLLPFAERYFAARGIKPPTAPASPAAPQKENDMDPKAFAAFVAKHSDHAVLLSALFGEGKGEAEMLAAIEKAQTANLAAKMTDLLAKAEKERNDHKAVLQAKDDQLAKLQADLAAAQKVAELGKGAPKDVGGLSTDDSIKGNDVEKQWATDSVLRAKFFDDKDAFIAMSALSFANLTGDGGPVSLAPKIAPAGFIGLPQNPKLKEEA